VVTKKGGFEKKTKIWGVREEGRAVEKETVLGQHDPKGQREKRKRGRREGVEKTKLSKNWA